MLLFFLLHRHHHLLHHLLCHCFCFFVFFFVFFFFSFFWKKNKLTPLQGFGLDNHVKIKVIQASASCSGTGHTTDGITGGNTGSGYTLTSTSVDKTTATRSWTLNQAQTSAKICFLVVASNYGGTGAYAATGGSDVVTVAEFTSRSPSQIGLYVVTRLTVGGTDLATGDKVALSTSTACTGSWITNVHDVSLLSATTVTVTPQATSSSAKICLKVAGSAVYHYTGHTVVIAAPTISSITPTKVVKGDAIQFTINGFGLGTYIKIRVVTAATGCSGTSDASPITGGAGTALTVAAPGEKTTGTHTFTLATGANDAKVCFLIPSTSYGGSNAYADFSITVDVIEISSSSPSNAGRNIQFYLYYDNQVALTTSDVVKIGTSGGACAGGDAANIVTGGNGAAVTYSSGYRTQFQLTAAHTNALICLKADGSSVYHPTGQTLTIGVPVINSRDDATVGATASNTFTFAGYGLDSNIKVKFVKSSCASNTDDTDDIITGGNGVTLSGNNAKTTSVDKTFTLSTASVSAKICILIPSASGGSGNYADTGLVVEIRGTARYLRVSTMGSGFLAGASPTAATTPFVMKISTASNAGVISTDEQHGVVSVAATIQYDSENGRTGTAVTLSGTTSVTINVGTHNGVITWTDLKINYWATAVRIRFTATTLSGTTMTASYRDSSNFIVGGIAKSLSLFTPAAGCIATSACTTQPVVKVLDAGGNVMTNDKYSGIQTITASVQDNTGCEHADSLYTNRETIPAGTTCTVASGVCTYSGQKFSTWANSLIIRYTATLPTSPIHTMTSSVTYVDSSGFTVKGTAAKIVLTFDTLTWVAGYVAQTNVEPKLTAPRTIVQDSSSNEITDSCVSGVPKINMAITSGTSNSGTITNSGKWYYTSSHPSNYNDWLTTSFSTRMNNIVVTFTASAPTHFSDMSQGTQVTTAFDVYALIYQRKITLQKQVRHFDKKEDQSAGTLQVATP